MTRLETADTTLPTGRPARRGADYPLRDYIGDMAHELAALAEAGGDEQLAALLKAAADRAAREPDE